MVRSGNHIPTNTEQIYNRCQYGRRLEGEVNDDAFVIEERRRRDRFLELQTDDRLWANMIRASYDLKLMDHEKVNDSVLLDLLKAGVYDWEKPNDWLHQHWGQRGSYSVGKLRVF